MSIELQRFTIWLNPNPPIQILYRLPAEGAFVSRELTGSTSFQGVTATGGFEFSRGASEFFVYGLNIAGSEYLRAQLNRIRILQTRGQLGDVNFRDETSPLDVLEITGIGSRRIMPAPSAPLTTFDEDNASRPYDRADPAGTEGNPISHGTVETYYFESKGILLFQGLHEFIEGYGLKDLGNAMTIYGLDFLLVEII